MTVFLLYDNHNSSLLSPQSPKQFRTHTITHKAFIMSTAIDYKPVSPSNIRSRHNDSAQPQPINDHVDKLTDIELAHFDSSPPPAYTEQASESKSPKTTSTYSSQSSSSSPTVLLQIETTGKPILSLPLPPHPDPIPIYLVDPASSSPGDTTYLTTAPKFVSLRPSRSSGSCYLISGDSSHAPTGPSSASSSATTDHPPLSTTTYRFGPGRPPRVRIFNPYSSNSNSSSASRIQDASNDLGDGSDQNQDSTAYSAFDILSSGLLTRAVRFKPPRLLDDHASSSSAAAYGAEERQITEQYFEWRYASRKERKAFASSSPSCSSVCSTTGTSNNGVDSLLILSKTTIFSKPYAQGKDKSKISTTTETETIPLARLIRNSGLRTKGSTPSSAGNGGRLEILDLEKAGYSENDKSRREMVLVMIVTTCLVMLKKEVDRRRAQQIAVLSSGGVVG
ncbi:hypothetical protein V8F20_001113 [Naviculisporaceae sp. PSN 640]